MNKWKLIDKLADTAIMILGIILAAAILSLVLTPFLFAIELLMETI